MATDPLAALVARYIELRLQQAMGSAVQALAGVPDDAEGDDAPPQVGPPTVHVHQPPTPALLPAPGGAVAQNGAVEPRRGPGRPRKDYTPPPATPGAQTYPSHPQHQTGGQ